jgi:hypothetical protein
MTAALRSQGVDRDFAFLAAFADWLACASAGAGERAARAMRMLGDDLVSDVAFAGTAGHVLDFDDTLAAGVAHVSAASAPTDVVVAAHLGLPLRCSSSRKVSATTRWRSRSCEPAAVAAPSDQTARRSRSDWPPRRASRQRCSRGPAPVSISG